MSLPYQEALTLVEELGANLLSHCNDETVSLHDALGRLVAKDIFSPMTTPPFDTSAMDGYAIRSKDSEGASETTPVWFTVRGTVAAGEEPMPVPNGQCVAMICVEIMTGARFPPGGGFDAVIAVERVARVGQRIRVVTPIKQNQHRRFAGSDFVKGDCIISRKTLVKSRHIMALASVGITKALVLRVRAGVWSTGLEIMNGMTNDANGPYLTAALREEGVEAEFAGVLADTPQALVEAIGGEAGKFEMILTTGAVSAGKFDFIRASLEKMKAQILFHHVAIRPGHPILCALLGKTVFFGLPGNPIAAAACMQFLVVPYLRGCMPKSLSRHPNLPASQTLDIFRHARVVDGSIEVNHDQSPAKIKAFSQSTCWVHIKKDQEGSDEQQSHCYLL